MDSPFAILSVDPDADDDEIEQAYRKRVKETHPDHGGSTREFLRVRAAYEELIAGKYESYDERTDLDSGVEEPTENRVESRIEYLNYEVLDDYGWSLEDDDLFEKAAEADLDVGDYGRLLVEPSESLLEGAENRGFAWPYACRGGACANCAVAVTDGEMTTPVDHILPSEMTDRGIRLSCVGAPLTEEMRVIYNVKHLPELDELRLPPRPFEQAYATD